MGFDTTNPAFNSCANSATQDPVVKDLCGAVADLTGSPPSPPYAGHNDTEMLYVASLAKIFAVYVAFELRKRVQMQAKSMIKEGLSTAKAGWEKRVFSELKKGWQPKLDAAFPGLPSGLFPKLADIFVLSTAGDATFVEASPAVTDADLDAIKVRNPKTGVVNVDPENGTPIGKYRDWMRLMLRWSNDEAASKCILPLSYPYINGVLGSAGFFDKSAKNGLWLSGDYEGNDWIPGPGNRAGQPLTPRWAVIQKTKAGNRTKSNMMGTAFQIARFMTALDQGKLVDTASSAEIINLATGAHGIGSYIQGALAGARDGIVLASKIGYGDDSVSHDCAIVAGSAPVIRYVSVILGSPPVNGRADFEQLAVAYNDCVAARHP